MNPFVYQSLPTRVVFGWGKLSALAEEIERLGARRALILTTPEQHGLGERVAALLSDRAAGVYPHAVMHVPLEVAQAARVEAAHLDADCCVAIGGGSTIGLGKAIAMESGLPIVAVPTTYAGAGLLLGLSAQEMADAIAIAVTSNVATRQTRAGELAMWKGCATAVAAKAGLFAAQLAKAGMTGPTAAFEGRHGLCEQVAGPFELGALGGAGRPLAIERTNFKLFAAEYHAQAPLAVALALRHKVRAEEIETLDVQIYAMAHSEIGSEPAKWDPRTRETADHSLPYMLAVALVDGRITPASFEPKRYLDPSLRPLMNRIRVAENPELTRRFPGELPSQIDVTTRAGVRFTERAEYPKGHARNPMTDGDIESKFRGLADDVLGGAQAARALDALWRLDEAPGIGTIVDLFTPQSTER